MLLAHLIKFLHKSQKKGGPGRYSKCENVLEKSKEKRPLYCYCKSVESGRMIACDDESCLIGWFHFECVNLMRKPRGDWYCLDCLEKK